MVRVRLDGLVRKGEDRSAEFSFTTEDISPETELAEISRKLELEGYIKPYSFVSRHDIRRSFSEWSRCSVEHPSQEVEVVIDKPSNFTAKQINIDDTFIYFYNHEDRNAMTAEIGSPLSSGSESLIVDESLKITFHRTLRMPDDDKLHQLPQSLGTFPLFNVDAFSSRLPGNTAEQSGIFFPMWQREAMWFQFYNTSQNSKYAIRINVGNINAISGLPIGEVAGKQDYVVVPGQPWLDGIAVEPGVVRQFVAMPLGSGYTLEGQITGEEKFGGIQIEVVPSYQKINMMSFSYGNREGGRTHITESQTPREYGLEGGSKIAMLPNPPTFSRIARICDLLDKDEIDEMQFLVLKAHNVDYLDSWGTSPLMFAPPPMFSRPKMGIAAGGRLIQDICADTNPRHIWNKSRTRLVNIHVLDSFTFEAVTHIVPPATPITANMYKHLGLPVFLLEENVDGRIDGGSPLKGVKSVSTMDKQMDIGSSSDPIFDPLKPRKCGTCGVRLCDCVIRPCNHQFCNVCIKALEAQPGIRSTSDWKCPTCSANVSHVAGFSAPMNLPGEEAYKVDIPVVMLKIDDGRVAFNSIAEMRM